MKDFTTELKSIFNNIIDDVYNSITTNDQDANNEEFNGFLIHSLKTFPEYISHFKKVIEETLIKNKGVLSEDSNTAIALIIVMEISCAVLGGINHFKEKRSEKKENPLKNKGGE